MIRAFHRSSLAWALLVAGCDVSSVVGYNEDALAANRCGANAPLLACDAAACVVRELAPAREGTTAIGVDSDFAYYFRTSSVIAKIPVGGGESVDLLTTDEYTAQLALDDERLYWTGGSELWRGKKTGGERELVLDVMGHPKGIALDATRVYATLTDSNQLVMTPKEPGNATFLSGQTAPLGIATDATHVYWVNQGTGAGDGEVVRAPLGELSRPEVLASGLNSPTVLALAGDELYFAAGAGLFALPKAGGMPLVQLDALVETKGLVAFSDSIYVSGMSGLIRFRGGEATVLESRATLALAVACSGVVSSLWFAQGVIRYAP